MLKYYAEDIGLLIFARGRIMKNSVFELIQKESTKFYDRWNVFCLSSLRWRNIKGKVNDFGTYFITNKYVCLMIFSLSGLNMFKYEVQKPIYLQMEK